MRFSKASPVSLIALLGALLPTAVQADVTPANPSPIVVSLAGPAAVHLTGSVAANSKLRAVLYASPSPDIPDVLLSRRSLTADAGGHVDAILPTAPAYVNGTLITVVVETAAGAFLGRGSVMMIDPTIATPAPVHHS